MPNLSMSFLDERAMPARSNPFTQGSMGGQRPGMSPGGGMGMGMGLGALTGLMNHPVIQQLMAQMRGMAPTLPGAGGLAPRPMGGGMSPGGGVSPMMPGGLPGGAGGAMAGGMPQMPGGGRLF